MQAARRTGADDACQVVRAAADRDRQQFARASPLRGGLTSETGAGQIRCRRMMADAVAIRRASCGGARIPGRWAPGSPLACQPVNGNRSGARMRGERGPPMRGPRGTGGTPVMRTASRTFPQRVTVLYNSIHTERYGWLECAPPEVEVDICQQAVRSSPSARGALPPQLKIEPPRAPTESTHPSLSNLSGSYALENSAVATASRGNRPRVTGGAPGWCGVLGDLRRNYIHSWILAAL